MRQALVLVVLVGLSACLALDSTQRANVLEQHNIYRRAKGIGELAYNTSFENVPQGWVDTCPDGHNPGRGDLGENYYASSSTAASTLVEAVQLWHDSEVDDYNCRDNTCSGTCGHLTQVLWTQSKSVACGTKTDCGGSYTTKVVCNYYPPGNSGGRPFPLSACTGYPHFSDSPYTLELVLNVSSGAFDRAVFIARLAAALGIAQERIFIEDDSNVGSNLHKVDIFIITYQSSTAKQQGDKLIDMVNSNSAQLSANQLYPISARYSSTSDDGSASLLSPWLGAWR